MDYNKIYIELMERATDREINGYTEKHHIVPKCMGGDNKPRSIALLTPEEHYVAHQLLVKIYPDNKSLAFAANMMVAKSETSLRKNKLYGWLKKKLSESNKGNTHGTKNKGIPRPKPTEEAKKNMSLSKMGNKNSFYGRHHSEETKAKIRESSIKHVHSEESRKKMSASQRKRVRFNPTGFVGVYSKRGKFESQIWVKGKNVHLGTFSTALEANEAYQQYKKKLNL